ncbi:MAG: hypothetical protein ACJ797_21350 [Ktedonobacteraceae bacterium]
MKDDENRIAFYWWTVYQDGREESSLPPSNKPIPPPPTEHPKFDYDKLIEESTGLYRDWWIMWKRIHPEWALHPEEPKELIIKPAPRPKPTFKPLSCKRCKHEWIPRTKQPPVSCPKCKSPYWNRNRVKRN